MGNQNAKPDITAEQYDEYLKFAYTKKGKISCGKIKKQE